MLPKFIKHLFKLAKDRVFQKSILNFMAYAAALSLFIFLTTHHVISHNPQLQLPDQYTSLPADNVSSVDLENALRDNNGDVQGLIFFKGLNSIVVLGNGLEHDQLVKYADVDEMRKLAIADKLPIVDQQAATDGSIFGLVSGWWWLGVGIFVYWLYRLLLKKREEGKVHSRLRVFFSTIPKIMGALNKASGLKPVRFYLYILIALVAGNALAFGLRLYHNESLYVLPTEIASAQQIEPWQIQRHLDRHPEEFARVNIVSELNTAYVVLASRSVPLPKAAPAPDSSNGAAADGAATQGAVAPMTGNPLAMRGPHPAPQQQPQPAKSVFSSVDHAPTLIARTAEFDRTAEGNQKFAAFVAKIQADGIEHKTVPAVHETNYFDSMTVLGRALFITLLVLALVDGITVWFLWHYEKENEGNPETPPVEPMQVFNRNVVGAGGPLGAGSTPLATREEDKKTFADVAGCQEAIDELKVVQKKIMRPKLYKIFGAPVPSGVILYGPPGTGKTLLARALAGEVGGSFQALSGSEFVEMYVGVGAKRVREAYAKARADARRTGRVAIIFIDEFDALAKKRGTSNSGGDKEYEQTLNQLLVEMNGFANHGLVLTMAATNRLDILDEAVLRPGRFDIKVKVPKPDKKGRALIYGIYLKKLKLVLEGEGDVLKANHEQLLDDLARRSHDFSGAEIEGSIKDGATIAVERQFGDVMEDITAEQEEEYRNKAIITPADLHLGIDKMAYGTQIRSRVRTDKERWATAVHEIGHASVPTAMNGDKVNRITIVMTDKSLGLMDSSPEEGERYDWTDEQFIIRLRMMLAGRAAEKVILGKLSTGASNDFERASLLARQMVGSFGMTREFGNKSIPLDQHGFPASNIGETMLKAFNDAWGAIIDTTQAETEAHIEKHRAQIEHCSQALYDEETLTGDDFRRLWEEKGASVKAEEEKARAAAQAPAKEGDSNAQR